MIKSQKLISLPVISLEDGLEVGIVRDLVIKPSAKVVYALIIDQRKWFRDQKIIPFSKIRSIGDDAITIEQNTSAQKPANLPEMVGLIKENVGLLGAKVIAEDGTTLGFVEEYYVDRHSGAILQLELGGNFLNSLFKGKAFLAGDYIKTLGKKVLVATEGASAHLQQVDGGIPEALRNLKDSSRHLLGNSWDKTVDMGKNLSRKLDKFTNVHTGSQSTPPEEMATEEVSNEVPANGANNAPGTVPDEVLAEVPAEVPVVNAPVDAPVDAPADVHPDVRTDVPVKPTDARADVNVGVTPEPLVKEPGDDSTDKPPKKA